MARYDTHRKERTRARIVESAGRRLKSDGIVGSGVSTLMSDAGFTNGAFYAHFSSKDDLVAEVVADQLASQHDAIAALEDQQALEAFVDDYLSARHRDHPADGCPSAALLTDVTRATSLVQRSYTTGVDKIIDLLASRMMAAEPAEARCRAIGLITVLVATVQLSRAVVDTEISDSILAAGRVNALAFLA